MRIGAPEEAQHILENQHQRKSEQKLEALVALVHGAQQKLDEWADRRHGDAGEQQHRQKQPWRHSGIDCPADGADAEVGAECVERATGEVDNLLHPENELQPGGNQKQHRGVEHAAEKDIEERSQIVIPR